MARPGSPAAPSAHGKTVPTETEIKLAFAPAAGKRLTRDLMLHPAVREAKRGRTRTARVVSTYYDTPDGRLAAAGIALRVRNDGGRWLQTVKGPPLTGSGGALSARAEFEWPLAAKRLDGARLATTPWRKVLGKAYARGDLAPRFTTDFMRSTVPLAFADGTTAKLCIDQGTIRAHAAT